MRRVLMSLVLIAVATVAAVGCGDAEPSASAGGAGDELVVTYLRGDDVLERRQLDCAGADAPLCERIAALLPELRPAPDEVCTEIYGGPERIELRGRLGGAAVDREFTRVNGCEIARYDRLAAVL